MTDPIKSIRNRIDVLASASSGCCPPARISRSARAPRQYCISPEQRHKAAREPRDQPGTVVRCRLARLFTEIMAACRALEDSMSVLPWAAGYVHQEAALKHFGGATAMVPCASIDEVFRQVETSGSATAWCQSRTPPKVQLDALSICCVHRGQNLGEVMLCGTPVRDEREGNSTGYARSTAHPSLPMPAMAARRLPHAQALPW